MAKKKVAKKTTAKSSAKPRAKAAPAKGAAKKVAKSTLKPKAAKASTKLTVYKGVQEGEKVPAFALEATNGAKISESALKGKVTVLYFYPKDNTPGCTLEGYDFKALHKRFLNEGAQIFGVSRDSLKSHESFKSKCGFPFELLTDDKDTLAKIFDVIQMKSLYGRKFEGIERSTFVIDSDLVLRKAWRKVKVADHAKEVLEFIENGMPE